MLGVLAAVCAVGYVAMTAQATQASYRIGQLKDQQNRLLSAQRQIRYDIASHSSAVQWDGDAARLGLTRSSQWSYISGSRSPVALARPEPTAPAPANNNFFDRLAVAFGRPTEAQAQGR